MAWFKLYKQFKKIRKRKNINMIRWYNSYLYNIWFYNLPIKERQKEIKKIKERDDYYCHPI